MISSMTAYARSECEDNFGYAAWEIRSFNHRYLDISFKLPEIVRELEFPLRELIRNRFNRGKIECQLHLDFLGNKENAIEVNSVLIDALLKESSQLQSKLSEKAPISPFDILRFPGVVKVPLQQIKMAQKALHASFENSLQILLKERAREGQSIAHLLNEMFHKMQSLLPTVRQKLPQVLIHYKERLLKNLHGIKKGLEVDHHRLEQEVVYMAQKMDVAEEIDRLNFHIAAALDIIKKGGVVGKQLDFLMQELTREANTLGAKSIDTEITGVSLSLKVLIEQAREQIQNLE